MADFTTDVTAWVNRSLGNANAVLRAIATDAVNRVKELTPVDTGFLRSNWTAVLDGDQEPVAGRVPDPAQAIVTATVGHVIVILNPTVYARRIEYGFVGEDSLKRHYNEQGRHMTAQTWAEMPQIAESAIARVRGQ